MCPYAWEMHLSLRGRGKKTANLSLITMKKIAFTNLTLIVFVAAALSTGCRTKRPDKNITPINGFETGSPGGPDIDTGILGTDDRGINIAGNGIVGDGTALGLNGPGGGFGTDTGGFEGGLSEMGTIPTLSAPPGGYQPDASGNYGQGELDDTTGMLKDENAFDANTVYFGYDSSVVRADEIVKLDEIVQILSAEPRFKLIVEGHCDERGTEEYNRSLGERRANSVREHLIGAGIAPDRVRTITYGEDKPSDFGHDEGSWMRNRRSEFILLRPPSN
jgi:peptidoglycan-associated lipoprotein